MTPFSARLTFLGLIVLAGAISVNALYMQPAAERDTAPPEQDTAAEAPGQPVDEAPDGPAEKGPRGPKRQPDTRADRNAQRKADQSASRPDAATPEAERSRVPARAERSKASREIVRAIQRELWHRGYPIERRDGQLDLATRLGILLYEYESSVTLTGQPSEGLLKHILFGPFRSVATGEWTGRLESDQDLVAEVQRLLSRLGFANLEASGLLGRETRGALREFATFRDLRPTGRLTPRLLLELADVSDEPFPPGGARGSDLSGRF